MKFSNLWRWLTTSEEDEAKLRQNTLDKALNTEASLEVEKSPWEKLEEARPAFEERLKLALKSREINWTLGNPIDSGPTNKRKILEQNIFSGATSAQIEGFVGHLHDEFPSANTFALWAPAGASHHLRIQIYKTGRKK